MATTRGLSRLPNMNRMTTLMLGARASLKTAQVFRDYSTDSKIPSTIPQAPNRPAAWSRSQEDKQAAMSGPRCVCVENELFFGEQYRDNRNSLWNQSWCRFEQTDFAVQVCSFCSLCVRRLI